MFHPANTINDPAQASREDFFAKDAKPYTEYPYQTAAQSQGKTEPHKVPDTVKNLLSHVKFTRR